MTFTALHRALGVAPGPLTDELLDAAVSSGVVETNDLDWKSELPPAKGLSQTDFPKDVAAMANSGGGVIVFGVRESQKAATGRVDVGEGGLVLRTPQEFRESEQQGQQPDHGSDTSDQGASPQG